VSTEKPPQCSQCNNPAFAIEFGPPLCLECFSKRPIEVPSPTRLATYALNVGTVQHIEAALMNTRARGGEDVAAALAKLMLAILDSKDLTPQARTAAFAQVDYLATQAAEPAPKRQTAAGKLVIDSLKTTLGVAKDVATIWQTVEPILRGMTTVDREQLRRDLSDALARVQRDQDVTDLDVLAASLIALEGQYAFHGEQLLKALEPAPRNYTAVIWILVRVLDKLERDLT
jgi:hypothetical protein